ncbi:MAG TPA: flagellar basal body-associated FliL family protein, partial [Dissulfurispiraceae bacterium]
LKATLSLELAKTPATERVKERVPKIRDSIIMLLTNKPAETIASSEGRVQFKEEVIMEINQILGENSVRNVYFTDFVKQ